MMINTENLISITEANQNFSKVVNKLSKNDYVVILKNNKPKYMIKPIKENDPILELTDNEKLTIIANRILAEHRQAFLELGK